MSESFELNTNTIPDVLDMVKAIQDQEIRQKALVTFVLKLHTRELEENHENLYSTYENVNDKPGPLMQMANQVISELDIGGKDQVYQSLALPVEDLKAFCHYKPRFWSRFIDFASLISDAKLKQDTLFTLLNKCDIRNTKNVLLILIKITDKEKLSQTLLDIIDKNIEDLENPDVFIPYIANEDLKKIAETLIKIKKPKK